MNALKNVNAYIEGQGIVKTDILFDKSFVSFSSSADAAYLQIPEDSIVVPGFIDQHCHGGLGKYFVDSTTEEKDRLSLLYAKSGVTAYLATTGSDSKEILIRGLRSLAEYIEADGGIGARMIGVHMEGPFLSTEFKGAMEEKNIIPPEISDFDEFFEAASGRVMLISLAPERPGASRLIEHCVKRGVKVSAGHSAATYDEIEASRKFGVTGITHTYNAQRGLHHREAGVVGAAMLFDDLYCEIISDCIHVSVPAIRLLIKNKPSDRVVMVSDATGPHGLPDGIVNIFGKDRIIKDGAIRLPDGTLSGSAMTLNRMLRCMVERVGVDFTTAVDFATINPARRLGIDDKKGSIAIGKDADFTVLSPDYTVLMTVCGGKIVYQR